MSKVIAVRNNTFKIESRADLEALDTPELLSIYCHLTKRDTKKFASRDKGVEQTWRAVQSLPEPTPVLAAKKPERRKREMRFRFAPKDAKEIRLPREGTCRSKAFHAMNCKTGATLKELEKETGWCDMRDLYEGIRLVHFALGHGMWHWYDEKTREMRIRIVGTPEEYALLVKQSKIIEAA